MAVTPSGMTIALGISFVNPFIWLPHIMRYGGMSLIPTTPSLHSTLVKSLLPNASHCSFVPPNFALSVEPLKKVSDGSETRLSGRTTRPSEKQP